MIGRIRYKTPQGNTVEVVEYKTMADLPVYCADVVDPEGEVIEFIDPIIGSTGLQHMAATRRWKELS